MFKFLTVIAIGLGSAVASAQTCEPVDLRSQKTMPIRSQINYLNQQDQRIPFDSAYCYAFTLANLVGQYTGVAVEPIDIGVQSLRLSWQTLEDMFPVEYPWGGHIYWVMPKMNELGYCSQRNFSKYLDGIHAKKSDWYMTMQKESKTKSAWQIFGEINHACQSRIFLNSKVKYKIAKVEESTEETGTTAKDLMNKIDSLLNENKVIALMYDYHYVTIVGRTEDCQYIIQDSVPHSVRVGWGNRNLYDKVEGEHFQYWSTSALETALNWKVPDLVAHIGYFEEN